MDRGRFCPRCGKEAREGDSFCTACGADLRGGGDDRPAEAERAAVAKQAVDGGDSSLARPLGAEAAAAAPGVAPGASGRKRLALVLGMIGGVLLVAGAVLLVLYLALWRGGGDVGDPLSLARKYMRALEEKDVEAMEECFDPYYLTAEDRANLEDLGLDTRGVFEWAMSLVKVSFSDVKLRVEHEDAQNAVVVTTAGSLSFSVLGWNKDFDLGVDPMRFRMTKREGSWYLTEDPINEIMDENLSPEEEMELFEDSDIRGLLEELMKDMGLDDRELQDLKELWREMEERLQEKDEGSPAEVVT
ncbi:zinc-ribbon domain-containing protein [Candidatus Solincola sp.]|nr:zinc ribbon domain-containing protein [Actinomycetota bacterium]MDI7252560.1 zinc ribbon domain-containing protein [Actinomycetota bacterium]